MIDHKVFWSAREGRSIVDQGFFQGMQPTDDNCRPGSNEQAVDITILFGQLETKTQFYWDLDDLTNVYCRQSPCNELITNISY